MNPVISVAIITYNHEEYIEKALDSVLSQKTMVPLEVIVGNDSSSDNTTSILNSYAQRYLGKVKVINNPVNLGFIGNLLKVLDHCKGEYVSLLEADDHWIVENKLDEQLRVFQLNPDVVFCYTNSAVDDLKFPDRKAYFSRKTDCKFQLKDVLMHVVAPTSSYMFKRDAFEPPSWFNRLAAYEYFLMYLVGQHGSIYYLNKCTSLRTQHYRGLSTTKLSQDKFLFSQVRYMQALLDSFGIIKRRELQNIGLLTQIQNAYHLLLNLDRAKGKKCLRYIKIYKVRRDKNMPKIAVQYLKLVFRCVVPKIKRRK